MCHVRILDKVISKLLSNTRIPAGHQPIGQPGDRTVESLPKMLQRPCPLSSSDRPLPQPEKRKMWQVASKITWAVSAPYSCYIHSLPLRYVLVPSDLLLMKKYCKSDRCDVWVYKQTQRASKLQKDCTFHLECSHRNYETIKTWFLSHQTKRVLFYMVKHNYKLHDYKQDNWATSFREKGVK